MPNQLPKMSQGIETHPDSTHTLREPHARAQYFAHCTLHEPSTARFTPLLVCVIDIQI
uniref:Uncharacterized protein n=1 Tax=Nelumbo nucifera TaxID=4432 RepID=A0A822Y309_NELNU|nr:TPA_asm: hypothetical protein HUJ06_028458 [Nelumbo nucifera]